MRSEMDINTNYVDIGKDLRKIYLFTDNDDDITYVAAQNMNEAAIIYLQYIGYNDRTYEKAIMALDTPYEIITMINTIWDSVKTIGIFSDLYSKDTLGIISAKEEK